MAKISITIKTKSKTMTPNPTFRCMHLQCSSFIMHNKSQSSKGIYSQNAKYNDVIYQFYQFF